MESEQDILFDQHDNVVAIWKTPAPDATDPLRWDSFTKAKSTVPKERYTCSLEVFRCIWIYDEQGLHFMKKDNAIAKEIMNASVYMDSTVRKTNVSLENWLRHWNFWKRDYRLTVGKDILVFRKEEYNSRAWSSVCFVEEACIKLDVPKPPWPPKCNLDLYTNSHKFNVIQKETAVPVKVWRSGAIQILGIPMHTILNRLNLINSIICPPGAYHGYIEVYDRIWEYGPQGLSCVLPDCSSPRENATLMCTGYTILTLDEWMKEWRRFDTETSFKSTANAYSLFDVNCLTFLTYALNALGVARPDEIQGLTRWMRQFLWRGKQLRVPSVGVELFIPPLSWVVNISWICSIGVLFFFIMRRVTDWC
ncbi:hypothetical protein Bhyg_02143 [Pseudolycoriella hygida]|uniref:Uncharacterized protein n=1 Tax=Pseudolycoriella hygida TaxID=35572 RepID=A0A9Q0S6E4_9DIPT|nr:hypothetical protein Bhyg_02143 [Pseudolycoriella hygida]